MSFLDLCSRWSVAKRAGGSDDGACPQKSTMPFSQQTAWLLIGALAGYAIMMRTNPVRESLRDGWLVVRRYPTMWVILGLFGFAHAAFGLGTRAYLAAILPKEEGPVFVW